MSCLSIITVRQPSNFLKDGNLSSPSIVQSDSDCRGLSGRVLVQSVGSDTGRLQAILLYHLIKNVPVMLMHCIQSLTSDRIQEV